MTTNFIESTIEEDIDIKNQNRIKNSTDSVSIRESASKFYVDNSYNDTSILKTAHVEFHSQTPP